LKFINKDRLFKNFDFPGLGTGNPHVNSSKLEGLLEKPDISRRFLARKRTIT
jgi:hypothetical protein